jgi:hypothetical protein
LNVIFYFYSLFYLMGVTKTPIVSDLRSHKGGGHPHMGLINARR